MGCDIHFYTEVHSPEGGWLSADRWTSEDRRAPDTRLRVNYDLFAMLAGVCNGYGFAGALTGAGFVPISPPKGMPPDCDRRIAAKSEQWGVDGHSHSYLTLSELLAYDWTQTTIKTGMVTPTQWARARMSGKPDSWCGEVSGRDVTHHIPQEFEDAWAKVCVEFDLNPSKPYLAVHRLQDGSPEHDAFCKVLNSTAPYTRIVWGTTYSEAVSEFLSDTIPKMLRLVPAPGAFDDARAVFWFDN